MTSQQARSQPQQRDQQREGQLGQSRGWPVPAALVALSGIPLLAGTLRLVELAGGPEIVPADDRFEGFPAALVVHIVGATFYAVVGAFQFVPGIRRRHLAWHRGAGRVLAVAGLMVAGSALWLTLGHAAKSVINLAVAEFVIRCPARRGNGLRRRTLSTAAAGAPS